MKNDLNKDKIESPFEAPEGYFEGFEENLLKRMNAPKSANQDLYVSHKRNVKVAWIAAASIAAILITGIIFYQLQYPKSVQIADKKVDTTNNVLVEAPLIDTLKLAQMETAVVENVLEEAEEQSVITTEIKTPAGQNDAKIEDQLEAAGLIATDINDGIFDEFEL